MTFQLLCEGACNPDHAVVVNMVKKAREVVDEGPPLDGYVVERLRALHHTPHVKVRSEFHLTAYSQIYACLDCGAERIYGRTITRD